VHGKRTAFQEETPNILKPGTPQEQCPAWAAPAALKPELKISAKRFSRRYRQAFYNNHENTPVKQAMPRDMRKKESTKFKYGFRVFAISCFRDVFLVIKIIKTTKKGVHLKSNGTPFFNSKI
jgi:hypothetical protein